MSSSNAATATTATVMDAAPLTVIPPPPTVALQKRYEALTAVRTKAINGKGAWYWVHLEPMLVHAVENGEAKAVKLRCTLCDALFSSSNPSRTATEHYMRGSCPNFSSPSANAMPASSSRPITSVVPFSPIVEHQLNSSGKRSSSPNAYSASQKLTSGVVDVSRYSSSPTTPTRVSAGVVDAHPVKVVEHNNAKKLKSPVECSTSFLSKAQVKFAVSFLLDWLYDSIGTGAVSLSALEHPKFLSFLKQIGLPPFSRREFVGRQLDLRYQQVRAETDARIGDALFFQLSSSGWNAEDTITGNEETVVSFTVNLPNGTTVFHQSVLSHCQAPSGYAEEVMWDVIKDICRDSVRRCAGIVADRFKSKALRELEEQNHWMVNLSCQIRGFCSLIKDFCCELPLFRSVASNCYKLASYFNTQSQVRRIFSNYQRQEHGNVCLIRVSPLLEKISSSRSIKFTNYTPVFTMFEDILSYSRAIQLVVLDETYKLLCFDNANARDLADMIRDMGFWNDLDATHSLICLIKDMVQEMQVERPPIGHCFSLWNGLRFKVKECCSKFGIAEEPVKKLIEKRFKKNYHPAWSAAFVLDPLYLTKDSSGKFLPPFNCLTSDQVKDVDKLITRLVSTEEAHVALMELMKWRSEGLDPLYAQAVQMKQLDPITGKMRIANPHSSRLVWETCLSGYKSLAKVAVRLIFLRATSFGFKCNNLAFAKLRSVCGHSRATMDRAHKLVFIAAHSKLERRDFSIEEDRDVELLTEGDDDVIHHSLVC